MGKKSGRKYLVMVIIFIIICIFAALGERNRIVDEWEDAGVVISREGRWIQNNISFPVHIK